ncbi:MAG TPA: D-glycerate dehydrogenase [Planctomycetaceae bacterium]|nr:D-glycerate dehydrogenase [Planctomycetaceae bacterium]
MPDPIPLLADELPNNMLELLGDRFEIVPLVKETPKEDSARVEGLITYGHPSVTGNLLDRCPLLKVVSNHGVGVDHIDVAAAAERNIPVGNTPGCLDRSTADMTMALILSVARNIVLGDRFARSKEFTHYDPRILIGQEVSGSVLGIVGMGRIGKEVARRARAFEMTILYHNRHRDEAAENELGVSYADLEELLAESDFVTLNCPLTRQTHHMISSRQLEVMKPSGILINMARGGVVDTQALYDALVSGQIAAAGLDVTEPEPLPRDHPLLKLDNVIILPHLGSASNRTRQRMVEMTVENLIAGIEQRELPYRVNG